MEGVATDLPGLAPAVPLPRLLRAGAGGEGSRGRCEAGGTCLVLEEEPQAPMRTNGSPESSFVAHR